MVLFGSIHRLKQIGLDLLSRGLFVFDDLSELLARTRTVVLVARKTNDPVQREFDHYAFDSVAGHIFLVP
jgi:hypothetical protein